MKRAKKVLMIVSILLVMSLLFGGGCVYYAFKIEPYRVKVNKYVLTPKKKGTEEIKIVQFSDVHIKENFTSKNLKKVVNKINAQHPDVVLFTGDLYDNYTIYHEDEKVIEQLARIEAKDDKIAIWGNRDYGGGAARQYASIMEQSGFTLLKNGNWYVTLENGKKILFTGLDDSMLGNPYMKDATKLYDSEYDVLLTHEPDIVKEYLAYGYDIVLSGHSHGGQINIPFLPWINDRALAATNLATEYGGGMYELSSDNNEKLYVNTGIGTTHISARFGVVPEVTVFYVYL